MKTTLILFSLALALYAFITLQADEMRAVCPVAGCVKLSLIKPVPYSQEWWTAIYNQCEELGIDIGCK